MAKVDKIAANCKKKTVTLRFEDEDRQLHGGRRRSRRCGRSGSSFRRMWQPDRAWCAPARRLCRCRAAIVVVLTKRIFLTAPRLEDAFRRVSVILWVARWPPPRVPWTGAAIDALNEVARNSRECTSVPSKSCSSNRSCAASTLSTVHALGSP